MVTGPASQPRSLFFQCTASVVQALGLCDWLAGISGVHAGIRDIKVRSPSYPLSRQRPHRAFCRHNRLMMKGVCSIDGHQAAQHTRCYTPIRGLLVVSRQWWLTAKIKLVYLVALVQGMEMGILKKLHRGWMRIWIVSSILITLVVFVRVYPTEENQRTWFSSGYTRDQIRTHDDERAAIQDFFSRSYIPDRARGCRNDAYLSPLNWDSEKSLMVVKCPRSSLGML